MNLYQINEEMQNCIDLETGEVDIEMLEALEMMRDEKVEKIGLWIKNLRAEAEALNAEKNAFEERQAKTEKEIENLTKYLTGALNCQDFKTTKVAISFRKSDKVTIVNEAEIPPEFLRYKTTTTVIPDKNAIKAAIKNNQVVAGAILEKNMSCVIK